MGLAIAKQQVELMGGTLKMESEPGKGSRFFFSLYLPPVTEEVFPLIATRKELSRLAEGVNFTALVVDDDEVNRDILSSILLNIGGSVLKAENGHEAVNKVREHVPDIVFMDIRMPLMNGIEAAQLIKEEFGKERVKVVVVSALDKGHLGQWDNQEYFDDFCSQPFRHEDICDCLARLLHITFEYERKTPRSAEVQKPMELDASRIRLPEEVLANLKEAAEIYNVTELEKAIVTVDTLGADGQTLAENLRALIRQYDMVEINNLLLKVHGES